MNELLEWASQRLKEAGTAQALANADPEWKDEFEDAAMRILRERGSFTSEEVVERIGPPPGHPSAVGAITRAFAKKHNLTVTYEASKLPRSHGALIGRWSRRDSY